MLNVNHKNYKVVSIHASLSSDFRWEERFDLLNRMRLAILSCMASFTVPGTTFASIPSTLVKTGLFTRLQVEEGSLYRERFGELVLQMLISTLELGDCGSSRLIALTRSSSRLIKSSRFAPSSTRLL